MNLLLDTHIVLWWLNDDDKISEDAMKAIADGSRLVFISAASIWEIRIKQALNKLILPDNFMEVLEGEPFEFLPITVQHANFLENLPLIHRDPFDRILIAQASVEQFMLVTKDAEIKKYEIPILEV